MNILIHLIFILVYWIKNILNNTRSILSSCYHESVPDPAAEIKCGPQLFYIFHHVTYTKPDKIPRSLSSVDAARTTQYTSFSRKWLGLSRANKRKRSHGGRREERERKEDTDEERRRFRCGNLRWAGSRDVVLRKKKLGEIKKRDREKEKKDEEEIEHDPYTAPSCRPTIVC